MKQFNPEELLKDERYKKRIQRFRTETLQLIINDRLKAESYVQKAIKNLDPRNLNKQYIEEMINAMQQLAKSILQKRKAV